MRRTPDRYDVIQASLVDTWAATAAGAYTLTENTLYTVEAFNDYLDHLTDDGVLTITRWVFDGLRLVSLAQAACEARGWAAAIASRDRPARTRRDVSAEEVAVHRRRRSRSCASVADSPGLRRAVCAGGRQPTPAPRRGWVDGHAHRRLRAADHAPRPRAVLRATTAQDIRPTTDDRPFFFHTTKLERPVQRRVRPVDAVRQRPERAADADGHLGGARRCCSSSARWSLTGRGTRRPRGWLAWLVYFGALGAGFMLIEVAVLQRFVLLLGHPVYSLTVTLFSLLLGTGLGAAWSRRLGRPVARAERRRSRSP